MKKTNEPADLSRRKLLAGIAGTAAGVAVLNGCQAGGSSASTAASGSGSSSGSGTGSSSGSSASPGSSSLPDPTTSGIDQIVVVMMENRSFDHYLGWLPGADGVQAGRSFVDKNGATQSSFRLTDFQNCASADPDHSYAGGRVELNNGAMDGFLQTANTSPPDLFPIGYYQKEDLAFFGPAATDWTVCDRYFCSILAETYPNRFYMHSGQTDRLHNSDPSDTGGSYSTLPTIWDALAAKGLTGHYYYSDAPFVAEYGPTYLDISFPFATFLADAAAGLLPAVSYIDPSFLGEGNGVSHDDHPLADIRNGQAFLNSIYNAIATSPQYATTLLIITYDEWGGFADHVVPPSGPVTAAESTLGNDGKLGFRIPNVVVGPRARRNHVEHTVFDHTSILNMIVWRFGLTPFYPRATTSNNFAVALDFSDAPNTATPPTYDVSSGPFGSECDLSALVPSGVGLAGVDVVSKSRARHILDIQMLRTKAMRAGYPVY